jgi:hypothetical protein
MARLSESDRRKLLGENFEAMELQFIEASRSPVTPEEKLQALESKRDRLQAHYLNAITILIAGLLIVYGNHKSGQPLEAAVWFGIVAALIGAAFLSYIFVKVRSLTNALLNRVSLQPISAELAS